LVAVDKKTADWNWGEILGTGDDSLGIASVGERQFRNGGNASVAGESRSTQRGKILLPDFGSVGRQGRNEAKQIRKSDLGDDVVYGRASLTF
jgi:hypothetical protein